MSGSGMIAAIPEGLAERFDGFMQFDRDRSVLVDDQSDPGSWARALAERAGPVMICVDYSSDYIAEQRVNERRNVALGIIMLAAARCTDVQKLADSGRIDRDGADLFIRRYSESIAEIVAELVPPASSSKGN